MRKSVAPFAAVALTLCGCSTREVLISSDKCWRYLESSDRVRGSATFYYFPDQTAFISNDKCKDYTIPVSLNKRDGDLVKMIYSSEVSTEDAIGMSTQVIIAGKMFLNKGDSRLRIRVSTIHLARDVARIDMPKKARRRIPISDP